MFVPVLVGVVGATGMGWVWRWRGVVVRGVVVAVGVWCVVRFDGEGTRKEGWGWGGGGVGGWKGSWDGGR